MPFVLYSADVKYIIVRKALRGDTLETINHDLGLTVSTDSLTRWLNLYHETRRVIVDPSFYNPRGRPTIFSNEQRSFIEAAIDAEPTIYLDELARQVAIERGVVASISTLAREVRDRLGLTVKVAKTVHPDQCPIAQSHFLYNVGGIDPACLVFLDESAMAARRLYRHRARAPRGRRTKRIPKTLSSRKFSLLPAISLSGYLGMVVQEGSIRRDDMEDFLSHHLLPMMNPYPAENSVLIMDNASIHCGGRIEELCEQAGVRLMYLPAYSPEFNPIEKAFCVIKSRLRRSGALNRAQSAEEEMDIIYRTADAALTPELIRSLFEGSVYL